ncbi:MAG TPA: hypothetical protein DHT43_05795 [Deltaproteobacteria bacterium]|nr:hypothetical protein [Deltaproteobacteria bacterium]
MKTLIKLGAILGALGIYLAVWPGKMDLYHLVVCGITLLLMGLVTVIWSQKSSSSEGELIQNDPELAALMQQSAGETTGGAILKAVVLGVVAFTLVVGIAWAGSKTFVYGMFYDTDFQSFNHELDVLEQAGNYAAVVEKLDERLSRPMTDEKKVELARRKYNSLITLGKSAGTVEEQRKWFAQAEEWAKKWKLDSALANAESRAVQPTPTPMPTHTPAPTYTPRPEIVVTPTTTPRSTPQTLPQGTWGKIVGFKTDTATIFVDMSIETREGGTLKSLVASDLDVSVNGTIVKPEDTYLTTYAEMAQPINLTIVFDRSGSMKGQPLDIAKKAVGVLVSALRLQDQVRAVIFDSEVKTSGWMTPTLAIDLINKIEAGTNTALWEAIYQSGMNIPTGRPHIIVIFTDGANTVDVNNLGSAAGSVKNNVVYAVGIESPDFNQAELQDFAKQSGGQYLPSSVDKLVETFTSITRETKRLYRLVIWAPGVDVKQVHISLSGGQIDLEWEVR